VQNVTYATMLMKRVEKAKTALMFLLLTDIFEFTCARQGEVIASVR